MAVHAPMLARVLPTSSSRPSWGTVQQSSSSDLTLLRWEPRPRWMPEQLMQRSTPQLRETQAGRCAPQSAQAPFLERTRCMICRVSPSRAALPPLERCGLGELSMRDVPSFSVVTQSSISASDVARKVIVFWGRPHTTSKQLRMSPDRTGRTWLSSNSHSSCGSVSCRRGGGRGGRVSGEALDWARWGIACLSTPGCSRSPWLTSSGTACLRARESTAGATS